jgi:hypothetical protein
MAAGILRTPVDLRYIVRVLHMPASPRSASRVQGTPFAEVSPDHLSGQTRVATSWQIALFVFLAALVYFLLFHRYGFFLQDEGVLAYQALRVSRGQLPYSDFQTAYTPAGYYLHALLFEAFGTNLVVPRVAASFACAATASLLFVAATRVLSAPYTLLPPLLYVLLEDQESRGLVVHTIPYPARYISTLWALSLCLTLAHARRARAALPPTLGLITAAITSFKHTAGIYNAWAVGLSLILIGIGRHKSALSEAAHSTPRPTDEPTQRSVGNVARGPRQEALRALPPIFLVAILAALPMLFGGVTSGGWRPLTVFCVPLAALVLLALYAAWPWGGSRRESEDSLAAITATGSDLSWFVIGAAVPTALWFVYFGAAAGFDVVVQRLILQGSAVARSYAIPFPPAKELASGFLMLVVGAIGLRALVLKGVVGGRTGVRVFALVSGALALFGVIWIAQLPWRALTWNDWLLPFNYAGRQIDNLAFYLAGVTVYAFLWHLYGRFRRSRAIDLVLICWIHGLCQLLLAYPRLDVAHLYEGIVILLIPGTVLLERTVAFFRGTAAPGRARWLPVAVACALVAVGIAKVAPRVTAQLDWRDGPAIAHRTSLLGPRGGLYGTMNEDAGWIASLDRAIGYIRKRTAAGTPIFTYPALSGIYFLSDRDNPSPMDYFHQGFGEGRDELAVIAALEETKTPLVVVMTDYSFDPTERDYFPMLKDYIRRHFSQTVYFAPYRVLERVVP